MSRRRCALAAQLDYGLLDDDARRHRSALEAANATSYRTRSGDV
jgi:hypothetical protein